MPDDLTNRKNSVVTARLQLSRRSLLSLSGIALGAGSIAAAAGYAISPRALPSNNEGTTSGGDDVASKGPIPGGDSSALDSSSIAPNGPTMPQLVGETWDSVDLDIFQDVNLRVRALAVASSGHAQIISQRPSAGSPLQGAAELTIRGQAHQVSLSEVAPELPTSVGQTAHGREWKSTVDLAGDALSEGIDIEVPFGAVNLSWHAWLPETAGEQVTVLISDDNSRQRHRSRITATAAQRTTIIVTGGERLRISTESHVDVPVVLGDPHMEVISS